MSLGCPTPRSRSEEPADVLRRVALVRGPEPAARLAATEVARAIEAEGGAVTHFDGHPVDAGPVAMPRSLTDASAYTLVVEVGEPLRPAEQLAASLQVPLVQVFGPRRDRLGFVLRRIDASAMSTRPLLDVDVDGARMITGGGVDVRGRGTEVVVSAEPDGTPLLRARRVLLRPAPAIGVVARVHRAPDEALPGAAVVSTQDHSPVYVGVGMSLQCGRWARVGPRRPLPVAMVG